MSRVGEKAVNLPESVSFDVSNNIITVSGPKGFLTLSSCPDLSIEVVNDGARSIKLNKISDSRQAKANHGTYRQLISNMIKGVTDGWEKKLDLVGVGFNAKLISSSDGGSVVVLSVGFSHDVHLQVPSNVFCETTATQITIKSPDRQAAGSFAAKIRNIQPPEPYLGKGIKYSNEVVRRKAGKTGKGGKGSK
jgi:large subunit ribosomal protein L6